MTVNDAKSLLFSHFGANDYFSLETDFKKIVPQPENEQLEKKIVTAALDEYVKQGIIIGVTIVGCSGYPVGGIATVYVLNKLLQQYTQNLELTFVTIAAISRLVNQHCEKTDENYRVDTLAISEKDIHILILLATGQQQNEL